MSTFDQRLKRHRHFVVRVERACRSCGEMLYPGDDAISVESNSGRVQVCGHDCAEAMADPDPAGTIIDLLRSVA